MRERCTCEMKGKGNAGSRKGAKEWKAPRPPIAIGIRGTHSAGQQRCQICIALCLSTYLIVSLAPSPEAGLSHHKPHPPADPPFRQDGM